MTEDGAGDVMRGAWVVFLCEKTRHPMIVGYEEDEYADDLCACGAKLIPVPVIAGRVAER